MMVLAVTLHNIPEGMAVGVVYAGFLAGGGQITVMSAFVLSLGIAIQNFPEGAIISKITWKRKKIFRFPCFHSILNLGLLLDSPMPGQFMLEVYYSTGHRKSS